MRWSPLPVAHLLRSRLSRVPPLRWLHPRALSQVARRTWQLAPSTDAITPPAYFLPGQLERVSAWVFAGEHPRRQMEGNVSVTHGPTRAHLCYHLWTVADHVQMNFHQSVTTCANTYPQCGQAYHIFDRLGFDFCLY